VKTLSSIVQSALEVKLSIRMSKLALAGVVENARTVAIALKTTMCAPNGAYLETLVLGDH